MQVPAQSFEVAQHLEASDSQSRATYGGDRSAFATRVADDVGRVEHDLREARFARGLQLRLERPGERDGVHAEVVEVHKGVRAIFLLQNDATALTPLRFELAVH